MFSALGLDTDDRRKDRTNVLCVVTADSGSSLLADQWRPLDRRTAAHDRHAGAATTAATAERRRRAVKQ